VIILHQPASSGALISPTKLENTATNASSYTTPWDTICPPPLQAQQRSVNSSAIKTGHFQMECTQSL
jgi:hypothetical protein